MSDVAAAPRPSAMARLTALRRVQPFGWPLALGLLALAFDLTSIGRPALWRDEAATIVVAHRSPLAILQMLRHDDAPIGAYYLFMHFWIRAGDSALWLRLPSAVGAALGVSLLYLLGKQVANASVGLTAAVVLAALPFSTRYAQEARPYALAMCGAIGASLLLVHALQDSKRASWAWYSVLLTVTVALHLVAALLIAAHLITCICANRRAFGRYRSWILASVPALLLAAVIGAFAIGESASHAWIPKARVRTLYDAAVELAGSKHILELLLGPAVVVALLAAVRWCIARIRSQAADAPTSSADSQRVTVATIALPWALLPGVVVVTVSLWYPTYVSRYLLFSLPGLALIAAYGLVQLSRTLRLPMRSWAEAIVLALIAAGALFPAVKPGQVNLRTVEAHGDDPAAEAAYLVSVTRPGDGIVYSPRDLVHSLLPFAGANQLPVDALLKTSAGRSHTINGVQVDATAASAQMLRFSRLWALEIPDDGDQTALADAVTATLASQYLPVSTHTFDGNALMLYQRVTN
jgi:mannosyltransferase